MQALQEAVSRCIDGEAQALNELSGSIWSKPELNYEEKHAHDVLCDFLEKRGFEVQRGYTGLETAFQASWDNFEDKTQQSPHVVIISEYDALPEIGHACGHNLIAEAGVAAGLAVKHALQSCGDVRGKITVMGTPAEEGGGGKVKLIDNGAFEDVDVAMMIHPASFNSSAQTCLAVKGFLVTYRGFSVHASGAPWEGVNALDAVVMAYNAVSSLRQQMKPSNRMHAIISKGGTKPNIIPDHTEMEIMMRALTLSDLNVLEDKVTKCLKGAALSTDCEIEIVECMLPYHNLKSNMPLVQVYEKHIKDIDPDIAMPRVGAFTGSTDMGNVSHVVPSIHPFYTIGSAINHTKEFTKNSGSPEAQGPTLDQAKAMARVALEVMSDGALMTSVKEHFQNSVDRSPEAQGPTLDQAKAMARVALEVMSDGALMTSVKEHFQNSVDSH